MFSGCSKYLYFCSLNKIIIFNRSKVKYIYNGSKWASSEQEYLYEYEGVNVIYEEIWVNIWLQSTWMADKAHYHTRPQVELCGCHCLL